MLIIINTFSKRFQEIIYTRESFRIKLFDILNILCNFKELYKITKKYILSLLLTIIKKTFAKRDIKPFIYTLLWKNKKELAGEGETTVR